MDDDWKANLRRSVEAARTAGAGKAVKATLLEEPRISRKEIEEALGELSRALPSALLVYTDDLPRNVVLNCAQVIAEDGDFAPDMPGSGSKFRRRSSIP